MQKYRVEGTLTDSFGHNLGSYKGETTARSTNKAKSNVLFHAKQALKLPAGANLKWSKDVKMILL